MSEAPVDTSNIDASTPENYKTANDSGGILPFNLDAAQLSLSLDGLEIDWSIVAFGPIYEYIISYGIALAQFNVGFTRGIAADMQDEKTDCFLKTIKASAAIPRVFDATKYNDLSYNIPDFVNLFNEFQVLWLDQYFACEIDLLLMKIGKRFIP